MLNHVFGMRGKLLYFLDSEVDPSYDLVPVWAVNGFIVQVGHLDDWKYVFEGRFAARYGALDIIWVDLDTRLSGMRV